MITSLVIRYLPPLAMQFLRYQCKNLFRRGATGYALHRVMTAYLLAGLRKVVPADVR